MRKIAFLVGNDTFPKDPSIPPLRFTQNDAREFAAVLEDRETCGFETRLYLNRPSQEVLTDLDQISGELGQDDTLLFYYSGHGKLRGSELCLVSNETATTSLGATSIRTRLVLEYLQGSLARRRILILDCCHSGAIASIYKAADSKSTLDGLANSFGSYILTASTTIELAEEREKDGHGVFTKALIDCLREGPKERITINDLYEYVHSRLKISAQQTPLFWALQQEGPAVEIGNYQARHERERQLERERLEREGQLERERLILAARTRLGHYVALGELAEEQAEEAVALLKRDEARLFPRDRRYRDDLIRFSKGEASFLEVFGAGHSLRNEPAPKPPENEVSPPITPPEAPVAEPSGTPPEPPGAAEPILPEPEPPGPEEDGALPKPLFAAGPIPPEPPVLDPPVTPSAPEVIPGTGGVGEPRKAMKSGRILLWIGAAIIIGEFAAVGAGVVNKRIFDLDGELIVSFGLAWLFAQPFGKWRMIAFIVFAIVLFAISMGNVPLQHQQNQASLAVTQGDTIKSVTASPAEKAPSLDDNEKQSVTASPAERFSPVFPTAVAPQYASEKPAKAREKTCFDQYKANIETNANGGMRWIQKGDGYWAECNKRLKE